MKRIFSLLLVVCMITACFPITGFAATEVVVKAIDTDSRFTKTGKWSQSGSTTVVGPDGDKHYYTEDKNAVAEFSASTLSKGTYGVYIYTLPSGDTTADRVDITIDTAGARRVITINGAHGGNNTKSWVYLGKYNFAGGDANEKVTQQISPKCQNGKLMRTYAVKFIKDDTNTGKPPYDVSEFIISANAASDLFEKVGTWNQSGLLDPLGGKFIYSGVAENYVSYKANSLNGNYGVYWYMDPPANATNYIDAVITASGKTSTIKLDGTNHGTKKEWVFLGMHSFNGNSSDKVVMKKSADADANNLHASCVRFVKDDTNTALPGNKMFAPKYELEDGKTLVLDTESEGFYISGTWKASSLTITGSQSYYSISDGSSATWLVDFGMTDDVEISIPKPPVANSEKEDPATIFEVYASGVKKQTVMDFTQGDNGWFSIGKYDFCGDGEEYIKIIKNTPEGERNTRAIALKIGLNAQNIQYPPLPSMLVGNEELHIFERMGMYLESEITQEYLDSNVTRGEMAVMLTSLFGKSKEIESENNKENFIDAKDHKYAKTLAWVKNHPEFGLKRQGSNSYSPNAYASKTDLIKFVLHQIGYFEDVDYVSKETKSFAEELGIDTDYPEKLTPTTMAKIIYSAFEIPTKNDSEYTFFEKMVRENGGIQDDDLLDRIPLSDEIRAEREIAKNKDRDIIYNNDGNDVYEYYPEYPGDYTPTGQDIKMLEDGSAVQYFLDQRTTGIEDTKVNTVFYCTGVTNSYTHITEAEEIEKGIDTRKRDWSYLLEEYTGQDTLDLMIDTIRGLDKDIFWSMRMNDVHDYAYGVEYLDNWKKSNLDKLFALKEDAMFMRYTGKRWSLMDYTYQETRQRIYDIMKDTLSRYDVDGIELDFSRWPMFFREVSLGYTAYPENIERMNELVRMIRALTEKYSMERGKAIPVAIYVPDSFGYCYDQGLDIQKWLDEDLFDIAIIGCHTGFFQPWEDAIGEYEGRVPVYAVIDDLGYLMEEGEDKYYADRNEAYLAYKAGAKGIYTYNYFDINHERFDNLYDIDSCGEIDPDYTTKRYIYPGNFSVDSDKYVTIGKK